MSEPAKCFPLPWQATADGIEAANGEIVIYLPNRDRASAKTLRFVLEACNAYGEALAGIRADEAAATGLFGATQKEPSGR